MLTFNDLNKIRIVDCDCENSYNVIVPRYIIDNVRNDEDTETLANAIVIKIERHILRKIYKGV